MPEGTGTSGSQSVCYRKRYSPMCKKFLFWMFLASTVLLVIGSFSGGWLRVKTSLKFEDYYYEDQFEWFNVYQDYGLWSVTQCKMKSVVDLYTCETRSYVLIDNLGSYVIAQLDLPNHSPADVSFDGIALVFSYSHMGVMQALYMVGTLGSVVNLYMAFKLRNKSQNVKDAIIQQNMIAYNFVPAILVMIPVIMFGVKGLSLQDSEHSVKKGLSPSGLIIAAVGGVMMFFGSGLMFLHTRVCPCTEKRNVDLPPQDPEEQ